MANYQAVRVKIINTQLNKLSLQQKNKPGTILRVNKKNSEDEELPHELFPTTRQTTNIRNAFANNMSTNIKLSKVQVSEINKSGNLRSCESRKRIYFIYFE